MAAHDDLTRATDLLPLYQGHYVRVTFQRNKCPLLGPITSWDKIQKAKSSTITTLCCNKSDIMYKQLFTKPKAASEMPIPHSLWK